MDFLEEFGERIKKIRYDNNLTQEEMADMLGFTRMTLLNYERGKRDMSVSSLIKLQNITPIDYNWLMTGKSPEDMLNTVITRDEDELLHLFRQHSPKIRKHLLALLCAMVNE